MFFSKPPRKIKFWTLPDCLRSVPTLIMIFFSRETPENFKEAFDLEGKVWDSPVLYGTLNLVDQKNNSSAERADESPVG